MNCLPTKAPGAYITYLCGGIAGLNDSQCKDWRELAKSLLKTSTLDPMRRDFRGIEGDHTDEIVDGDIADIRQSNFILVNATKPSWGTALEIVYAMEAPSEDKWPIVVAFTGPGVSISPWLQYHCAAIFDTLEEAVGYINADVA